MFTGIVECRGRVASLEPSEAGRRLEIDAPWPHPVTPGESICISGVCLTAVDDTLRFDVIPETLDRSTLGGLSVGDEVNLERSCTPTTLLGGHVVQGHVDGRGEIAEIRTEGEVRIRVRVPDDLMAFAAPKGSICIEGVSLTLAALDVEAHLVDVTLIPTTLDITTLGSLRPGDMVNLEMDSMAKIVVHWLEHYAERTR